MKILVYILGTLLAVSVAFNIVQYKNRPEKAFEYVYTVQRDTVFEHTYSTDTVWNTRTDIEYITKVINDTVFIADIPQTFTDSTENYDIDINAVKLNWYNLNIHTKDTVTLTETIYRDIIKEKTKSRFGIGLFAGPTYNVINRTFDVSVGVGITFDLTK